MSEVAAGQTLAGYTLIELGGTGGMGRVYRAVQPGVDRVVAVKVIRPEVALDREFRERFEVESRLAASIDHPNVIPVYEADEDGDVLYVAMRWVAGPDLRQLLMSGGPLASARAVDLLGQLAGGLDAAHAKGLIHRDIKPANVLLEGEHAYLTDFGLARRTDGSDETTQVGGLVGTVDYLAPELVNGGTATMGSDVYALGCVLFQMLTGSVPFPVDGLIAKLHAHTTADPPAPSTLDAELPRGFDTVVRRALAKDPGDRYASAGELADAARRALHTAPHRPSRRAPSRRTGVLAVGAVTVVALVAAVVLALTGALHGSADAQHDSAGAGHASTGPRPASAGARPSGRNLPAAASLPRCGDLLTAPAGDCRNATGGVSVLALQGATARMRTMDFEVTRVIQSRAIFDPNSRDTVTAPAGQRFVVIECAIANRTRTAQVFEPNQDAGRQTELFLSTSAGSRLSPNGPDFAEYTAQDLPAAGLLPLSLAGGRFPPPHRGPRTFRGALVFSYPVSELRSAHSMLLFVHEFGRDNERSGGVFRLPAGRSQFRPEYEGSEF